MVTRKISIFTLVVKSILLVSAESDPVNYRLPSFYNPFNYSVRLYLGSELFTPNGTQFSGQVEIGLTFSKATDYIALRSHHMLELNKVAFENVDIPSSNYSVSNVTDILTIHIGRTVTPLVLYHLAIEYTGHVNTGELSGLYKSSYVDRNGETKYLVTTGPGSVRKILPCFDEPTFRSYFNVTIIYPTIGLNVLFNTKDTSRIANDSDRHTTAHFQQTPRMTVGSLALIVSDLTCSFVDDTIRIQVCSREETASQRHLALDVTPKLLAGLNNFTNFNYSHLIGKLDIVAVPDFPAAGMEKWGLQIHRESELLSDDVESSTKYKEDTTLILAHELAHQWFGNLIIYYWYSEVFLQEGFARYFEYYIVNEAFPHYESEKRFIMDHLRPILVEDGTGGSLPLHIENITAAESWSAFTPIAYDKGGSIIRMVRYFMSSENFRTGIQKFIKKHQYSNVDSEDLWIELSKTISNSVSKMPASLSTVMKNWIWKTGYPLLTVSLNGENITISQSKFSYFEPDDETKWYIPVSYTKSSHKSKFQSTTPDFWITPDSNSHVQFPPEENWLILNNQQIGYYRVNYDNILWARIKAALQKEEFDGIIDINRAQIIDDLFNLARADILPYSMVLDSIRFLKNDTSYYPWKAAIDGYEFLLRRVGEDTELGKVIGKDLLDLIDNFYNSMPISKIKLDDHSYTMKQMLAVEWACRLGHESCVKDVVKLFKTYKFTGKRPIQELRYAVYCNGLKYSEDESDWHFMWEAFMNTKQASEKKNIRKTLGCSSNTTLLKNYLQKTITKDSGIRSQEALHVFTAVGGNPAGVNVAFDFMIENQEQIIEHYQTIGSVEFIILGLPDRLTSEERIEKLIDLVNTGNLKEGFKEYGKLAAFVAKSTEMWLHKYSEDLATYYKINTYNYWNLLYLLFLIPVIITLVGIYFWFKRRERFLIWMRNMNPMNFLARIGEVNNRAPAENIPMRER